MNPKDDQAIREVVGQWQAKWNVGDMQAAPELIRDVADSVNVAAGQVQVQVRWASRLSQRDFGTKPGFANTSSGWTNGDDPVLAKAAYIIHLARIPFAICVTSCKFS